MGRIHDIINYIEKNINFTSVVKYGNHTKYFINDKIFAIVYESQNSHLILKANGRFNIEFRKEFKETVFPSYVINKYHWNMILVDGEIPTEILCRLIEISYDEVIENMTKRQRYTYEYLLTTN